MEMSGYETRDTRTRRRARLRSALEMRLGWKTYSRWNRMRCSCKLEDQVARGLHARGWRFYKFVEPDIYRLICSWSITDEEISMLVGDFVAIK